MFLVTTFVLPACWKEGTDPAHRIGLYGGLVQPRAVFLHGSRSHLEGAVLGVPELHLASARDRAAVADEVVVALLPQKLRVDGDGAREALGAEEHASHRALALVPHTHIEQRVEPGFLPVARLQHLHARRRALLRPRP